MEAPSLTTTLILIGFSIQMFGNIGYIKKVLKGEVKPNRVTWLMWTIAAGIGAVSGIVNGAGLEILPIIGASLGPCIILLASFVNPLAYWKVEKFDIWCGIISTAAIVLWIVTKDPLIAYIFSIIADLIAGIPTFIKAWKHPETEHHVTFITSGISQLLSIITLKTWVFTSYGFNVSIIIANTFLVLIILRKKIMRKLKALA